MALSVAESKTMTIKDPGSTEAVDRVLAAVRDEPGVVALLGPADPGAQGQVSKDGHAALGFSHERVEWIMPSEETALTRCLPPGGVLYGAGRLG